MLRIANILNLAYKTIDKKSRKSKIAKVNYNEKKQSIKITFDIQKIIQRDNVLSYY